MKIVIPIAGRGSRFHAEADKNPEYKKPKPLINIKGKPMVMWALESLPFVDLPHRPATTDDIQVSMKDIIFICLEEHQKQYKIVDLLKGALSSDINVVLIPNVTRGALETALSAKQYLDHDDVIVTDCDHFFNGDGLYKMIKKKDADTEGVIPVFRPPDSDVKWSYTLFSFKTKRASAVAEKDAVLASKGAYANIGAYYFSHGDVFVREAQEVIDSNAMYGPTGKQEFYVAPLYQRLIDKGMKVQAAIVPEMWGLGTPKDVTAFLQSHKE